MVYYICSTSTILPGKIPNKIPNKILVELTKNNQK